MDFYGFSLKGSSSAQENMPVQQNLKPRPVQGALTFFVYLVLSVARANVICFLPMLVPQVTRFLGVGLHIIPAGSTYQERFPILMGNHCVVTQKNN